MIALFTYGEKGAVPVFVVAMSVWYGLMIVFGVGSTATLLQYAWGGSKDA
jgi:hypothetical protein